MSYEGQDHHPHKRGYPPSSDLLLASRDSIPPSLELLQAHWFVRHGERAPVRQRMVGLGEIPAVFELCSVGRQFTSAVLTLSSPSPIPTSQLISTSPAPSNPFLSSTRHTTSALTSTASAPSAAHTVSLESTPRQLSVTRYTQDVSPFLSRGKPTDCYWGELTDLGRESTLRFGSILRQLYTNPSSSSTSSNSSFLPKDLDSNSFGRDGDGIVHFRSTNMPRTIESLHQIIQGLYPPSSHSQEDSLRIPFMVRNWMDENLYPNAICKRLRQLDAESIKRAAKEQNPQLERLDEKLKPLFNNGVGIRIDSTSPRASGVLDTLMVCRAHGIKVPSVLDDVDVLRTLENGVVHEWFDGYKNPEFKRLAMGRLFSDLHHHLSSKIEKPQEERLKLSINSCHDTSVGGILNALDVFDGRWPPFTSFVGIELFSSSPQNSSSPSPLSLSSDSSTKSTTSPSPSPPPLSHFVRVLYNGRTLSLPGCQAPQNHLEGSEGKICTWEAFSKVLNKVKMSEVEWKDACGGGE